MNARDTIASTPVRPTTPPRFDAKFIEDHKLIERYLESKLPLQGRARSGELVPRASRIPQQPQAGRARAGQPEAAGSERPAAGSARAVAALVEDPLTFSSALAAVAVFCLAAFWALLGKYTLLRGELEDARTHVNQGSLVQPATDQRLPVAPDRAPGIDQARISVSRSAPQLMDLHIDMSYSKLTQFRMFVDKQDQGRALILNNVLKDSNNELRLTFNTTGLAAGIYTVRIEALPPRGSPMPTGWLILRGELRPRRGTSAAVAPASALVVAQRHDGRRVHDAPRGEGAAHTDQHRPADEADDPHPGIEGELAARTGAAPASSRRRSRRTAARVPDRNPSAENSAATPLQHRAAARPERAQHRAFVAALIARRLHRRQQHHDAGDQREQEHVLHRQRGAVHDVADLLEDRVDVEHRHVGTAAPDRPAPGAVPASDRRWSCRCRRRRPGARAETPGRNSAGSCPSEPCGCSPPSHAERSRRRRRSVSSVAQFELAAPPGTRRRWTPAACRHRPRVHQRPAIS